MLCSLFALAIAIGALQISHRFTDEIIRLLMRLLGLLSLSLSLVCAIWPIKLLVVAIALLSPDCDQQPHLRRLICSPFCSDRANCPLLSLSDSSRFWSISHDCHPD